MQPSITEAPATTEESVSAPARPLSGAKLEALKRASQKVLGHDDFLDIFQVSRRGGLALIRHHGELKVFKFIGCRADWKKRWARLVGWNPARRAVNMSRALVEAGISVCEVEDHGTVSLADAPRAVWTISRYVENGRTLRQLKEDLQPSRRSPQHAVIERLFADGMRLMRRIHDAGFEHRDYHAGNLLVTPADETCLERGNCELRLVDLETVMQRRVGHLRRARDVRRYLENFVEPDDYRAVVDRALGYYAPDDETLQSGIRSTRRMQGLLRKKGARWEGV
ncbi:MAG: hypothetical protein KDB90_15210 [Planctomycetes bacterium]|nr:hypothetical protein [Planctomycetota bacterium]